MPMLRKRMKFNHQIIFYTQWGWVWYMYNNNIALISSVLWAFYWTYIQVCIIHSIIYIILESWFFTGCSHAYVSRRGWRWINVWERGYCVCYSIWRPRRWGMHNYNNCRDLVLLLYNIIFLWCFYVSFVTLCRKVKVWWCINVHLR